MLLRETFSLPALGQEAWVAAHPSQNLQLKGMAE